MWDSVAQIQQLIDQEMDLGIANTRIILGGFSQGAAMVNEPFLILSLELSDGVGISHQIGWHHISIRISSPRKLFTLILILSDKYVHSLANQLQDHG
jgi:predicted esterase